MGVISPAHGISIAIQGAGMSVAGREPGAVINFETAQKGQGKQNGKKVMFQPHAIGHPPAAILQQGSTGVDDMVLYGGTLDNRPNYESFPIIGAMFLIWC
jgi:hypothetical protein